MKVIVGCRIGLNRFTFSNLLQKFAQQLDMRRTHMTELSLVHFVHGLVELLELLQTLCGDAGLDDTPIVLLPLARNAALLFETVEKAGHVGVARNHAIANDAAGEALRTGAAKDAKDVVLGASKAVGLDELFGLLGEEIRGL
jgi:nucleotide-binding universal stress UspA family protein